MSTPSAIKVLSIPLKIIDLFLFSHIILSYVRKIFTQGESIMNELLNVNVSAIDAAKDQETIKRINEKFSILVSGELSNIADLEKALDHALIESNAEKLKKAAAIERFNYQDMKESFIADRNSINTKKSYLQAFNSFETFLRNKNIKNPFLLNYELADDWITDQKSSNEKSNNTIRRNVACLSSFFSDVERKTAGEIKNYFRGTRKRPEKKLTEKNKFYFQKVNKDVLQDVKHEIDIIIESIADDTLKAIIRLAVTGGYRVGSFETMELTENSYKLISKGKKQLEFFTPDQMEILSAANLRNKKPFKEYTADRLKHKFKYYADKLYESGNIKYKYSFHDLRHYFALSEYLENHDIYRLSKLLNHSSIVITENYLKGFSI